ncbi:MAG: type II toxin-antitoxin system HicB family antitoxin [Methanotrichaceae archaeon]
MRFKILISEVEGGWFVVECPSLPGCVSQGRTVEEALENIKDAIQGCLDVLNEITTTKGSGRVIGVLRLR